MNGQCWPSAFVSARQNSHRSQPIARSAWAGKEKKALACNSLNLATEPTRVSQPALACYSFFLSQECHNMKQAYLLNLVILSFFY